MKLYQALETIEPEHRSAVVAIGNFDGVHRGHQALIKKARTLAKEYKCAAGVLTFSPHPRQLFRPDQPAERLTPDALKFQRLEKEGADFTLSLPFDWEMASLSAEGFIKSILKESLDARHVITGEDFRFGQMRQGTPDDIRAAGIKADEVSSICDTDGKPVSSSRIREALKKGKIERANNLLGWNWEVRGEIVGGDKRGRELGYPTANLMLGETIHPAYGVYACRVQIEGESEWRAAAVNIGIRPMFEVQKGQLEAYILDFPFREIYGRTLRVWPVQRLRGEAKFDSLEALKAQMKLDCHNTRTALENF